MHQARQLEAETLAGAGRHRHVDVAAPSCYLQTCLSLGLRFEAVVVEMLLQRRLQSFLQSLLYTVIAIEISGISDGAATVALKRFTRFGAFHKVFLKFSLV